LSLSSFWMTDFLLAAAGNVPCLSRGADDGFETVGEARILLHA